MNYKILERNFIDIPSASGVEWAKSSFWVIGDDAPFLFQMNEKGEIIDKITLFDYPNLQNNKIPKSEKIDFEAITIFEYQNNDYAIVLGSGANEKRKTAYTINLNTKIVQKYRPENLYESWQENISTELNIEGLCTLNDKIFVFQRGNIGENAIFVYDADIFWGILVNQNENNTFEMYHLTLPNFQNIPAGISGACALSENEILFCASYENTNNAIDDGEVLGSLLGIWNFDTKILKTIILEEKNLKIESICIKNLKSLTEKNIKIYAVTDADGGKSEMLLIEI